jgi:hypothetical protein
MEHFYESGKCEAADSQQGMVSPKIIGFLSHKKVLLVSILNYSQLKQDPSIYKVEIRYSDKSCQTFEKSPLVPAAASGVLIKRDHRWVKKQRGQGQQLTPVILTTQEMVIKRIEV